LGAIKVGFRGFELSTLGHRLHKGFMMFQLAKPFIRQLSLTTQKASAIGAVVLLFLPCFAQAAQATEVEDPTRVYVDLNHETYFARKQFLFGEQNYTNLYGRLKGHHYSNGFISGFNVGAMSSLTVKEYTGVHLSEAYVGVRQTRIDMLPTEAVIGTKLMPWSKLDADWGLGMWQPMKRWDFLHPEQEGLTGIFLSWQGQYGSLVLFGSGIFQPEQGAFFKIKNRHLTSSSPWFSEPADYANITGGGPNSEILYTLNLPDTADIVSRASAGGMLTVGQLEDGGWAKVAYIYKPRNRLHLPFTGVVLANPTADVDIQIYPRVEYHHLGSLDLGYTAQGSEPGEVTTISLSMIHESPVDSTVDTTVNRQYLEPLTMVSPSFEARMNDFIFPTFSARASYLKQVKGGMRAAGPLVTTQSDPESFFGYRSDFTNAMVIGIGAGLLKTQDKKLEATVRWIEEFDQRASLLMLELRYEPSTRLGFMVAGDFLGSRAPETDVSGLLAKFRGNDRILGGVVYAF
jgi:hypothetical protein